MLHPVTDSYADELIIILTLTDDRVLILVYYTLAPSLQNYQIHLRFSNLISIQTSFLLIKFQISVENSTYEPEIFMDKYQLINALYSIYWVRHLTFFSTSAYFVNANN